MKYTCVMPANPRNDISVRDILENSRNIAVIGLSDNPERYSHIVASYLMHVGYIVIPVNPNIRSVLGSISYPSLPAVPPEIRIDIVDIFRKPEHVPEIAVQAVQRIPHPVIWMQEGITSPEGRRIAESGGITVIENACIMKAHRQLAGRSAVSGFRRGVPSGRGSTVLSGRR